MCQFRKKKKKESGSYPQGHHLRQGQQMSTVGFPSSAEVSREQER